LNDGSFDDGEGSDGSFDDGEELNDGEGLDGSYDDGESNDGSYDDGEDGSDGSYDDDEHIVNEAEDVDYDDDAWFNATGANYTDGMAIYQGVESGDMEMPIVPLVEYNGEGSDGEDGSDGSYDDGELSDGSYDDGEDGSDGSYDDGEDGSDGSYDDGEDGSDGSSYDDGEDGSDGSYDDGEDGSDGSYEGDGEDGSSFDGVSSGDGSLEDGSKDALDGSLVDGSSQDVFEYGQEGDGSSDPLGDDWYVSSISSSSEEFDPFNEEDINTDFTFSDEDEDVNEIQSSFESSLEDIEAVEQEEYDGTNNIFDDGKDEITYNDDGWTDDDATGHSTLFFLSIAILAICIYMRRRSTEHGSRSGYRAVPNRSHISPYKDR